MKEPWMQSWMPRDPQVLWYGNKKESFLQRMEIYIYIYIYVCRYKGKRDVHIEQSYDLQPDLRKSTFQMDE